ncbi:LysM peptidoglycan-binding domain-containing protein [Gilvimarinus sp. DA14]|uniref:lytic transglycosylase n=1 Tax=Gilvimarinus sp. DA14 TaxID=2956798 RepID=UPI0020B70C6D|nr:LysM peptidoglycan-binding domain-containing protein [Gilvimarinus sp. DA14]UTF60580.1 LysM peptidoglycan-binding domain-containing protein [Gilvimarinus sp. DA14]
MSLIRIIIVTVSIFLASCGLLPSQQNKSNDVAPAPAAQALPSPPPASIAKPKPQVEKDLWVRIRDGFALGPYSQEQLDEYVSWYASHPEYIERVFTRGQRYLYHIVERVEAQGLPLEIALMPVVESAFDPFAYSYATASGMWQFMSGTGREYGLKQNWWYDGRRDIIDSTDAALAYLERLHQMFDDNWLHALAAYNTGQGRLQRSINRNAKAGKPTDFWSLSLPRETRAYVPQLLALSKIIANPEKYDIELPEIVNAPYFVAVDIDSQIDLARASELAEISMDELYLLNPGYNRWATDPEGPHRLLIPASQAEGFSAALATIPVEQRISWQRYTIKRGDSLIKIAKRFNTSPEALRTANNLTSSRIRAGATLLIPSASEQSEHYAFSSNQRRASSQSNSKGGKGSTKVNYVVKKGDSFWRIANQHKVSVNALAKWNGMSSRDTLRPGQKLVVWSKTSSTNGGEGITRRLTYKVRSGDSLDTIARKFNVSIQDISRWNNVAIKNYIHPGQQLTLYVDVTGSR